MNVIQWWVAFQAMNGAYSTAAIANEIPRPSRHSERRCGASDHATMPATSANANIFESSANAIATPSST